MNRLFKFNIVMFFLIMITAYLGAEPAKASDMVTISYEATHHQSEARGMLSLLNEFRTGGTWYWNQDDTTKTNIAPNELQPLQWDEELEKMAIKRAEEIAIYYSHTRANGGDFTSASGGFSGALGENLVMQRTDINSAFLAWREDDEPFSGQGHRRNMLYKNYKSVGIACVEKEGKKYWVQNFSDRRSGGIQTAANNSTERVSVQLKKEFIEEAGIKITSESHSIYGYLKKGNNVEKFSINIGESEKLECSDPYILTVGAWEVKTHLQDVKLTGRIEDESIAALRSDGTITGIKPGITKLIYEGLLLNEPFKEYLEIEVKKIDIGNSQNYYIDIDSQNYTGKPIEPKDILVYKGISKKRLIEGQDYTVEYKNNVKIGEATVIAKGINNYEGELADTFEIVPVDGEKFDVSGIIDKNYTGGKIYQNISIFNSEGKKLIENVDYTLKYSDNIEPGEATIDIEYKGNYQGNVSKYFNIIEKDKEIKKESAKFNYENNLETSQSRKDNVKIKNVKPNINKIRIDKGKISIFIKFKKGISYKLQYFDNKKMIKPMTIKVKSNKSTIKNLISGKTYYIRIGILKNGKMNWSAVKKIKIK